MLDFLLVLGQIPGTNFQITFNDLVAIFCVAFLFHEYKKNKREIKRWRRWAWYRLGVNYRRYRRQLRTLIRIKRYRLAVFERRLVRQTKTYLRRQRRALYMAVFYRPYSSLKRRYYIKLVQISRLERRAKSFIRQPG